MGAKTHADYYPNEEPLPEMNGPTPPGELPGQDQRYYNQMYGADAASVDERQLKSVSPNGVYQQPAPIVLPPAEISIPEPPTQEQFDAMSYEEQQDVLAMQRLITTAQSTSMPQKMFADEMQKLNNRRAVAGMNKVVPKQQNVTNADGFVTTYESGPNGTKALPRPEIVNTPDGTYVYGGGTLALPLTNAQGVQLKNYQSGGGFGAIAALLALNGQGVMGQNAPQPTNTVPPVNVGQQPAFIPPQPTPSPTPMAQGNAPTPVTVATNAPTFTSRDQVVEAVKAGKIDRNAARQIIINQGL
jgi:hypothetical protein